MPRTITAMEARKKFGEILNQVSLLKEDVIIERAGKKIARIVPLEQRAKSSKKIARIVPLEQRAKSSGTGGKLDFRQAAGLGKDLWEGIDVEKYVESERKSWD